MTCFTSVLHKLHSTWPASLYLYTAAKLNEVKKKVYIVLFISFICNQFVKVNRYFSWILPCNCLNYASPVFWFCNSKKCPLEEAAVNSRIRKAGGGVLEREDLGVTGEPADHPHHKLLRLMTHLGPRKLRFCEYIKPGPLAHLHYFEYPMTPSQHPVQSSAVWRLFSFIMLL